MAYTKNKLEEVVFKTIKLNKTSLKIQIYTKKNSSSNKWKKSFQLQE